MTQAIALVTGTPGWLGRRFVQTLVHGLPDVPALAAGNPQRRVRCLVLPNEDASALKRISPNVEVVPGDVRDPASVHAFMAGAKDATVFHAAGVVHPQRAVREFYDVNVDGTKNVLAAAQKAGVRRFVHISSNSPIGCNPNPDHVFDETSPYNPYMNYGRSKKLAEDAVNEAAGALEIVIMRPPWFYGPDQPARQTLFFSMIKAGKAPLLGDGANKRSMGYIDNLCQGMQLCETADRAKGQTYWIADARPYPMREILDTVERLMESEFGHTVAHKRMRLPSVAADVALVVDKIVQGAGFYHQKFHVLSEMNKTIACTIAKAQEDLGYSPKIDLEEGMRRSLRWVHDQGIKI